MEEVRVTCVPKAGSPKILKNHRGIFNVSIFRDILMKILYNRNYPNIDDVMSEFTIIHECVNF